MKFNDRNVFISPKAKLGQNVRVGDNCTIYDHVEIADNSVVCNDSVIGEPTAEYYRASNYENAPTFIGADSLIRSHAIIYAGCEIGPGFSAGHRITIRECTRIGEHCGIGSLTDIQGNVTIGKFCRMHSSVHIAQTCSIGDFVSFYPFSVMTNDPFPPSTEIRGGHVGSYTQVGVHAIILPGIHVGENCLIGAGSVVNKRVPDFSLVTGNPARILMDIRKYVVMGKGHPYPWMTRFDRGMPWEGVGYDTWIQQEERV